MKKFLIGILPLLAMMSFNAHSKEYSSTELRQMVNSGNYPAQGSASKESKTMSFENCKMIANRVTSSVSAEYPVETIVNTAIIYTVKAWTADSAVTITCSNNKLVMTTSPYI